MTDVLHRMRALRTTLLSDALDRLGLPGALLGIRILSGEDFVGPAFTVGYVDIPPGESGDVGDYLDIVPAGAVVVIANNARTDCSIWGSLTTLAARRGEVAGTVIDGACRDIEASRTSGYPIAARDTVPRTGKDRVRVSSVGESVTVAGVVIEPGDLIIGDADGVVCVPHARAADVLEAAEYIQSRENLIADAILAGATIANARATHGYMSLQRPADRT